MGIEDATRDLYGVPLAEFTARRTALAAEAKLAGDAELAGAIGALRKPVASAWLVNMLARHRAERVAEVVELGETLREAQDELDAPRLRALGRQRSTLVRQLAREAGALAAELGGAASAAAIEEVAQTLQAAMTDADAAALVQAGALVRPLTAASWGAGDGGADVIAFPSRAQRAARRGEPSEGAADARQELADATAALETAQADAERLRAEASAVAERRTTLRDEVEELTRQLREAKGELADADDEARRIRRDRDQAKRALSGAERALARAQARVDKLDG
jgi:hypothetical protein